MPPLPTRLDTQSKKELTPPGLKWMLSVYSVILTTSFVIMLHLTL